MKVKTGLDNNKWYDGEYVGQLDYSGKDQKIKAEFPSIANAIKDKAPIEFIKALIESNQADAINQSILINGKIQENSRNTTKIAVPTAIYALEQNRMDVFLEHTIVWI